MILTFSTAIIKQQTNSLATAAHCMMYKYTNTFTHRDAQACNIRHSVALQTSGAQKLCNNALALLIVRIPGMITITLFEADLSVTLWNTQLYDELKEQNKKSAMDDGYPQIIALNTMSEKTYNNFEEFNVIFEVKERLATNMIISYEVWVEAARRAQWKSGTKCFHSPRLSSRVSLCCST